MANYFPKNVKYLRQKNGLSVYDLAKKLNVAPSTVYRLEDGPYLRPQERTVMAVSNIFDVPYENPLDVAIEQLGSSTGPNKIGAPLELQKVNGIPIPLITPQAVLITPFTLGDDVEHTSEADKEYGAIKWLPPLPFEHSKEKKLVAFMMEGEALSPEIKDGDTIFIDGLYNDETLSPKTGQLVLAESQGGVYIRKLMIGENNQQWLIATNPQWPGNRALPCDRIYGVVVGLYRKI